MKIFDSSEIMDSKGLELIRLKKVNLDESEPVFRQRHSHSVYEFYVCLRGSYVLSVDSQLFNISEGTAFLVSPGVYHMTQDNSPDLFRVSVSFRLDKEKVSDVRDKLNVDVYSFKVDKNLLELCRKVFLSGRRGTFFYEEVNSVTTILLIELLRDIGVTESREEREESLTVEDYRISEIDAFFDKYLLEEVTCDMLSQKLFISNRQLNRIMKKAYGLTFNQKLIAGRLDRAAWLLRTTDKPASEICLDVGYESKSYFYRAFREQYKLSPNEYRKKMRDDDLDL